MSYKLRLARLEGRLEAEDLCGLLVTCPDNRRFLSGFEPGDPQLGESSGAFLASRYGCILATDFRYQLTAQAQVDWAEVFIYPNGLAPSLPDIAKKLGVTRLGFEAEWLTVAQRDRLAEHLGQAGLKVELRPVTGLVERLRVNKDRLELMAIRRAIEITEAAFTLVLGNLSPGKTELDVAWEIVTAMRRLGAEDVAFPPIVVAGPMSAEPHAEPSERPIEEGEPVLFDIGAKKDGYCSDFSRTVIIGEPDDKFREVYAVVRRAQTAAIEGLRPGMRSIEADHLARSVIEAAGYGDRFGHALGHGVGLATHEAPSLSARTGTTLEPGMVFTIEPGVYLPGWGGVRLEEMVVLTEDGAELLNRDSTFYDF